MQDVTLIGIDLGKHSFHVHGQDRHGKALLRMKFNRKQLIEFFAKFHKLDLLSLLINTYLVLRLLKLDDVNGTPA